MSSTAYVLRVFGGALPLPGVVSPTHPFTPIPRVFGGTILLPVIPTIIPPTPVSPFSNAGIVMIPGEQPARW